MDYLNLELMNSYDPSAYRNRHPFPWWNPEGFLTERGYERLVETLPDVGKFERIFGLKRMYGQMAHDRYALNYHENLDVAEPWHALVRELRSDAYNRFLKRMFGRGLFRLEFHWHYTPAGASVSPHCDARRKLGTQIFYFNTDSDWKPEWGGQTVMLEDGGKFTRKSAPKFEDFLGATEAVAQGNRSLLFTRTDRSWHGVRAITCPDGALRKVFIMVADDWARGLAHDVIHHLGLKRQAA
jgi:2-oxoglutarate-Fe(II)-dependent oxygenase superfamily protein